MIRFSEVFRCAGVDEEYGALGTAGMIVPVRGSNIVALETHGQTVKVVPDPGLFWKECDHPRLMSLLHWLRVLWDLPGVDGMDKLGLRPKLVSGSNKLRFFRFEGRAPIGFPGRRFVVKSGNQTITLNVVVLAPVTIKVAIRDLQVRDARGSLVFHAGGPCDPVAECQGINMVWVPQANIRFELVPSSPAIIDDQDEATRDAIRRGYGYSQDQFKDIDLKKKIAEIDTGPLEAVFAKHLVPGADLTFFFVGKIRDGATGRMLPTGMGFVTRQHFSTTFAHEAGHFILGTVNGEGVWENQHHTGAEQRHLMRAGGAGWKIPFGLVESAQGFLKRRAKLKP